MPRHLTLTIESSPIGIDLIALLEHEFRPFDYKQLEAMEGKKFICRWNKVTQANAALLTQSLFGKNEIGSITLARLVENGDDEVGKSVEVRDGVGVSEQIGISIVRSGRLAK